MLDFFVDKTKYFYYLVMIIFLLKCNFEFQYINYLMVLFFILQLGILEIIFQLIYIYVNFFSIGLKIKYIRKGNEYQVIFDDLVN